MKVIELNYCCVVDIKCIDAIKKDIQKITLEVLTKTSVIELQYATQEELEKDYGHLVNAMKQA